MVLIQLQIPKELDKKLAIYNIKKEYKDKRIAIIKILEEKLNEKSN